MSTTASNESPLSCGAVIRTASVDSYLAALRPDPDSLLAEMQAHGERDRIPIVGPETGALLHVLALTRGARRIVEVGTAIGVSTLNLARALPADGTIISFEIDAERHSAARDYLERAGLADRADLRLQDARAGLAELDGGFDMAFIDGVKAQYVDYFDLLLPLLGSGAVLAVDNVLMSGTVADNRTDGHWTEEQIAFARGFNERLLSSDQLTGTLTPVGDGVFIAVKR